MTVQPPPKDPQEALTTTGHLAGGLRARLEATDRLAKAALEARTPLELFQQVHAILRGLLPAENLHIALWDRAVGMLSFPYWVDAIAPAPPPRRLGRGLIEHVLREGQPLLVNREALTGLEASGQVEPTDVPVADWLGVPLRGQAGVFGALVIQGYEGGQRPSVGDRNLLSFVSTQVAMALERSQALAEQRVLQTVLANSQAVIYQLDSEGRFLLCEGLGLAPLGLRPGEVVGRGVADLLGGDPEALDQALRALTGVASREVNAVHGRLFDTFLTPVFNGQGRLESVIGIATDVTERQQIEAALRQSQKLESLGTLASGIAHDFNNLLTVVLGNLNLAQMHLPDDSPAQPYLANMEATVMKATELTRQMLAYAGRGHFFMEPIDLNGAVKEVVSQVVSSIHQKVHLQLDLEPDLPTIQADAAQIQQAVRNLVTNASDAIGDQAGVIRLSTSTALLDERELQAGFRGQALAPGRHVLLEVTDSGTGMPPEVLASIFDPFYSTKTAGKGLGLSAILGTLRGHGAGLRITSVLGGGSSFLLCFRATDQRPGPSDPGFEEAPAPLLRGRILLVDDEDLILQAIGSALEAIGLEVLTARDGREALERFRSASPRLDLVLMDLTMPRMDGREAFQAMHDLDPSVPVVLSSGFSEQDSLQTLAAQGPAAFMQKPYQIKELRQLLQRVLGR